VDLAVGTVTTLTGGQGYADGNLANARFSFPSAVKYYSDTTPRYIDLSGLYVLTVQILKYPPSLSLLFSSSTCILLTVLLLVLLQYRVATLLEIQPPCDGSASPPVASACGHTRSLGERERGTGNGEAQRKGRN
jgi:hypothetical protein